MAEHQKIPSGKNTSGLTDEQLQALLQAHAPARTGPGRPPVEAAGKDPAQDPFYQDAIEGLKAFESTARIHQQADKINRTLLKKLRRSRRKKPVQLSHVFWYIIAVVVIVMAIVLAFAVIRLKN